MARKKLRPHQREAVDAVVRALELPAGRLVPQSGLRTQVIMATGSGKSLVAVHAAEELRSGRVLVLVPSLDLLVQTAAAWREGGRTGRAFAVCSLRGEDAGVPTTTDPAELARWAGLPVDRVTVFATYASLGLGTIEHAHREGLPGWDLIVVDEAHRTSGRIGKPWAVVHDNTRIPAVRRLYMTATPRVWQDGEEADYPPDAAGAGIPEDAAAAGDTAGVGGGPARTPGRGGLVASMEDDPAGPFGARCYTLTLSEAIDRGICAPYRVVCVDVSDPDFQAAVLLGPDGRSDAVRGVRLAALQTALVKAAVDQGFRRTLVFHHLTKEAEAFAAGLPAVAARLRATSWAPRPVYPRTVWADWLCGQHTAAHRRRVLGAFADDRIADKAFLGSVRVLGEGVDTKECDSVFWADVRGSMPDLVQAVGRALRVRPGEGKVASLVVPVLLGPGESPETMLSSRAYGDLARLLEALRAHDTRLVEALAQPQAPSRRAAQSASGVGAVGASGLRGGAEALLSFSVPRDPALLAAFVRLRVLHPEHEHWRRGVEAARLYAAANGDLKVPFTFKVPEGGGTVDAGRTVATAETGAPLGAAQTAGTTGTVGTVGTVGSATPAGPAGTAGAVGPGSQWPPGLAGFPLGQWIADARRTYRRGALGRERAAQLDELGMVWSHFDVAFEEGLAAAAGWAEEHGHLLPPVDAVWRGAPVGVWVKNQRAAARREGPGALSEERREALEAIDASWCPAWEISWQRAFHLTRVHLDAGGRLPQGPGEAVVQGEDLGVWLRGQRQSWERLSWSQRWLLEHALGVTPAEGADRPRPRVGHAAAWAAHLEAARQFHDRERHLRVPRTHVERVGGRELRLGAWIANQRSRAASLTEARAAALTELGMRWSAPSARAS
ncbi:Helicase associated domain protein [Streptomyces sp. ISL-66]|uniref:DEAD/DEAH box helicase n=1 Tax=Streptomyces sp. ISL-66 TaxID=2819186 RepID=UPI001BECDBD8|nr:DEAD/DEAH box helicase [Streptomyces sp. ISL-66]MBT2470431.1 Helicase associated domain protein [Streptomyces sp. ISL-66]